jgi:hypothetical protein
MLLVAALFAFYCYKRQLATVGDALLETQPRDAGKTTIEPQGNRQTMKNGQWRIFRVRQVWTIADRNHDRA